MAKIIDGKALASGVRASARTATAALASRGIVPGLAVILAGEDPASLVYVRNKVKACQDTGIRSRIFREGDDVTQAGLLARIARLNDDPEIHGILVQLPLPRHLDADAVLDAVSPAKDVDGFHPANLGALLAGRPRFVPCTPAGIMHLLDAEAIELRGRRAVIVGRSNIVGKPVSMLLLQKDATVTMCHSRTRELGEITREADVLVAAVGHAGFVGADMVKPGACVIDVGINRLPGGGLAGDVDFDPVSRVAGWLTPVPGGVGPMTVAMLMSNTVRAASSGGPAGTNNQGPANAP